MNTHDFPESLTTQVINTIGSLSNGDYGAQLSIVKNLIAGITELSEPEVTRLLRNLVKEKVLIQPQPGYIMVKEECK
jgi:hypothetical protein